MPIHHLSVTARRAIHWHRPLMIFAAVNVVLAVVAMVGMAVDDQLIAGSLAWFKPFKFAVSFVLYSLAWAWMMSSRPKGSRVLWWAGTFTVAAGAIEMIIIIGQVLRGTRSHFNVATPFDAMLWNVMAGTIVVLFLGTLVAGLLLAFQRLGDAPASWAIRFGIVISLAGMALGQLMVGRESGVESVAGAHTVGAPDGTPGLPLTGWSTTHGDLRIPHFIGMHALQLLPLFAALLVLSSARIPVLRSARVRLGLVSTAAFGYAGFVALVTWQALLGEPLLHPDGTILVVFGLLVAAVCTAATAILLSGIHFRQRVIAR